MATQTGSIDLRGANSAKLYVDDEAGEIRSEVSETYATKTEVRRTDTGSGTVVTSDDAANLPPLSLTVHGKSVQDGTPSPSSPVEIESVEGRNLLKTVAESWTTNGLTVTINTDATVTMRGTATAQTDIWMSQAGSSKNLIYVPAGSYTLSASKGLPSGVHLICSGNGWNGYGYRDLSGVMTHTSTVTDASKPFSYFLFRINSGTTVDDTIGVMLEAGTQATDFIPYGSIGLATNGVNIIDVADVASTTYTDTYYYELNYANNKMPRFNLEAGTTYTLSATVQTDVVPFQMSVGCGTSGYSRDIANKGYNAAGRVSITFTPTAAQLESGTVLAMRAPRYSTKQTFTFSLSDIQLELGSTATEYEPYTEVSANIPLQGNALRSLPDGTEDVLAIDSEGNATLTKRIGLTTTATTDGISATVGTDAMSTTGTLADGATVIYKLATPQTISLGTIDLPSLPSPSFSMHVDAAVSPTVDAEWWTQGGEEVGSVYQRVSSLSQTSEGFTAQFKGVEQQFGEIGTELSGKASKGELAALEGRTVSSSEEWVAWMHAGTDATTHEPYLAMGQSTSGLNSQYTSSKLRFMDGDTELASLSGMDGLSAPRVRVEEDLKVGPWAFVKRSNGNLTLKYIGG